LAEGLDLLPDRVLADVGRRRVHGVGDHRHPRRAAGQFEQLIGPVPQAEGRQVQTHEGHRAMAP